jgi:hypothetical protein
MKMPSIKKSALADLAPLVGRSALARARRATPLIARAMQRRQVLSLLPAIALPAAGLGGCRALAGEETIEAHVVVKRNESGNFAGWSEYKLGEPAAEDEGALLKKVLLRAPEGVTDLRFITSLLGEAVTPTERTPLVSGSGFPANDTMAALEVLYDDDLRPFFPDGQKIRIEWSGTIDLAYPFPEEGIRVDALITVEVL